MKTLWGLVLLSAVFATASDTNSVVAQGTTDRNREVVRRHLELMNRGDWKLAAAICD